MSGKRSLPLWTGSKDIGKESGRKKQVDSSGKAKKQGADDSDSSGSIHFSKLLDGVVFALSGFVNPERSSLRSQALDMGAEYRQDWTSDCTLLVSAFSNTPKFRQVKSENGTIVSKEWILECYNERKLVEIEPYLMHAGKPWRKNSKQLETDQVIADQKSSPSKGLEKQIKRSNVMHSAASRVGYSTPDVLFSPSKIKEWAVDDLIQTMSWLESQEEKPDPSELKAIAAEGILTCLQDVIESLEQSHDVRQVTERWKFVPHVAKELVELERMQKGSLSKEELTELAIKCKNIYKQYFDHLDDSTERSKKQKSDTCDGYEEMRDVGYDSDRTIEMTEEEIDLACRFLPENCE
ncbi:DNA-repair protein XRCC1 [Typha angustifolia]|uniref:DNA-repair protein XRCC1 n=1 Tax=Typha angustifolia TaxID=59011 RepID=UPI003C2CEFAE